MIFIHFLSLTEAEKKFRLKKTFRESTQHSCKKRKILSIKIFAFLIYHKNNVDLKNLIITLKHFQTL